MGIEFILGTAASGKTTYCYHQIEEALKEEAYNNLLVLVPEQFDLQTQKELCNRFYPGLLRVDVLSFTSLVKRVQKESGYSQIGVVDDLERMMILKKLLQQHKKELKYFKKSTDTIGFLEGVNRFITICEQSQVGEEGLDGLITEDSPAVLQYKVQDIKHIYGWFQAYIQDKFVTVEQTLQVLASRIPESKLLEDAVVWVDGFYGFTAIQVQVLLALAKKVKEIKITLPADRYYGLEEKIVESHPFYEGITNYQKICQLALEQTIPILKSQFKGKERGTIVHPLDYLEQHYLATYSKPYEGENNAVFIKAYKNKEEEIGNTLQTIMTLIREEQYRYKEIAILVGDFSTYKASLESGLKAYQIPYFLDKKRSMHTNSLVAVIQNVLEVIATNWSYKSIMALLRTYMLPIPIEDIDKLENTLLLYGIKGSKRWKEEWQFAKETETFLETINAIRKAVIDPIERLEAGIKACKNHKSHGKIKDLTTELVSFLEYIKAADTLEKRVTQYTLEEDWELVLENQQVWGELIEVLDRLVAILGEEEISLTDYKNLLRSSFSYMEMGMIPPTQDQLLVGTMDRTRLPGVKALFVLGTNEGVIPKLEEGMELFSAMDKVGLKDNTNKVAVETKRLKDTLLKEPFYESQFMIYAAFTRATKKLYVSCIESDEKGKGLRPSPVFYKLKKLFPQPLDQPKTMLDAIQSTYPTFELVGKFLRRELEGHITEEEQEEAWKDAVSWYMGKEDWKEKLTHLVDQLGYTKEQHYLDQKTLPLLYKDNLETSVSKLETFRNCPCCYFLRYGIKAEERKVLAWDTKELGTLFHTVLEQYPKELSKKELTWRAATTEQMNQCVQEAVSYAISPTGVKQMDGKLKYTASKLYTMSRRAIRALTYQVKNGAFDPKEYEVSFGRDVLPAIEIQLEEGKTIRLSGQIDRVDVYSKDGEAAYVKIMDYKSGKKNFDLVEVFYGLQLQLLLYLDAYLKYNQKLLPAGIFYFHIDTPYIQYKLGMSEEDVEKGHMKNFKLSGLVLEDPDVINLLDTEGSGDIIPASLKKDGTLTKASSVASIEQFEQIRSYILDTIKQLSTQMLQGRVSVKPYKLGNKEPCSYCKYKGICQFDEGQSGDGYDQLEKLDKEEIWNCIQQKVGD